MSTEELWKLRRDALRLNQTKLQAADGPHSHCSPRAEAVFKLITQCCMTYSWTPPNFKRTNKYLRNYKAEEENSTK